MELRFQINDQFIEQLQERAGIENATELARRGLELLNTATIQAEAGRQLHWIDEAGNHHVPIMAVLDRPETRW